MRVQVTGRAGVPLGGVGAVVLNVTAIEQTSTSSITVFPSGAVRPNSSNLNPTPGITAPNLVVAKVGIDGQVDLYNSVGTVHLIVDIAGWFPVQPVASFSNQVASGGTFGCSLTTGDVYCWGTNNDGQTGQPSFVSHSVAPVKVAGLYGQATAVAAGISHGCAVLVDTTVKCWGTGGRLGYGGTASTNSPVSTVGLAGVVSISAGDYHTCALVNDGNVWCWGENNSGSVGVATSTYSVLTPTKVVGVSNAVDVSAGGLSSCAVLGNGTIKCWGAAQPVGPAGTPQPIAGISTATKVATALEHTCVLLGDRTVQCFGGNSFGQLSTAPPSGSGTPITVAGVVNAVGIVSGPHLSCAVLSSGLAKCWGRNTEGGLGDGTTTFPDWSPPVDVVGLSGITSMSAGGATCAIASSGRTFCWGGNFLYVLGFDPGPTGRTSIPTALAF